jgi:hypothetical protein
MMRKHHRAIVRSGVHRILQLILLFWAGPVSLIMAQPASIFMPAGSMSTPRVFHTATLLLDGRVLVAGGTYGNLAQQTAELYDPTTRTFSLTGMMLTARTWHTSTLLADGRVLIAGGRNGAGVIQSSAELYDPLTGSFTPTGNMTTPLTGHAAAPLNNGKVFIVGGLSTSGPVFSTGDGQLYDPATGTFTSIETPVNSLQQLTVTATSLPDGRILVAPGPITRTLSEGEYERGAVYDPLSNTFAFVGSPGRSGAAGYWHTASLLQNGSVLACRRRNP